MRVVVSLEVHAPDGEHIAQQIADAILEEIPSSLVALRVVTPDNDVVL